MKAPRNRTIAINSQQRGEYLAQCLTLASRVSVDVVCDRVLLQDLLECVPMLPDGFADLIVADPPYNLSKDFNGLKFRRTDDSAYREYLLQWLPEMMRLLKDGGSIYVCCDWQSSPIVYEVLSKCAVIRNRITWQREKGRGATRNWKNASEDIWFATKGKDYYFDMQSVKMRRRVRAPYRSDGAPKDWQQTEEGNFRDTCPSNLWDDISIPFWSMPENTDHPTQKPEKLMAKLILASCPRGGIVFDPFGGSGTSAVTAKKLGRHYCTVEINPDYCAMAMCRLEKAEKDSRIQGYEDGVFWERNAKQK